MIEGRIPIEIRERLTHIRAGGEAST